MKFIELILAALILSSILGCKTPQTTPQITQQNLSILGSWEGCDGRVVNYMQKGDSIIGRYTKLSQLESLGFTKEEIAYKLISERPGVYSGKVKWRARGVKIPTWYKVRIEIDGNNYRDEGSDRCGKNMTRLKK